MTADPIAPARTRAAGILGGVAWIATTTVLQLARPRGGIPAWNTIWAEDGLALGGALTDPLRSLAEPLGGQLQVLPRLLTHVAAGLPLGAAAAVIAIGSAILVGGLSWYVFRALASLLPSRAARAGVAGMVALAPAWGPEALLSATGLRFAVIVAAFAALAHRRRTSRGSALAGTIAALGALSSGLGLALVPVAIWRLRAADAGNRVAPIALLAGSGLQLIAILAASGGAIDAGLRVGELGALPRAFGSRVGGALLLGDRLVDNVDRLGDGALAVAGFVIAVVVAAAVTVWTRDGWIAAAAAASIGALSLPIMAHGGEVLAIAGEPPVLVGSRYVIAPLVLLIVGLLRAFDHLPTVPATVAGALLLAMLAAGVAASFSVRSVRAEGPRWSKQVEVAGLTCEIVPAPVTRVPIAPAPAGQDRVWFVDVPCIAIRDAALLGA